MTINQFIAHEEQMEAYRRDFAKLFAPRWVRLKAAGATDREIALIEHREWREWLKSKKAPLDNQ